LKEYGTISIALKTTRTRSGSESITLKLLMIFLASVLTIWPKCQHRRFLCLNGKQN